MITILTWAVVLLLAFAGLMRILDIVWDRQDKERLRKEILDFWIRTAELEFIERLQVALKARYERMRSNRWRFIYVFWILCLLVGVFSIGESIWNGINESNLRSNLAAAAKIDLRTRYSFRCDELLSNKSADEKKKACNPDNDSDVPPELKPYKEQQAKFQSFIASATPFAIWLSSVVSNVLVVVIVAVPLTLALLISLNLTLWLLSRITQSGLRFMGLVIFDLFVATVMPPLLTSLCLLFLVGFGVVVFGQIIGFGSFNAVNWVTITIGSVGLYLNLSFLYPSVVFLFGTILPLKFEAVLVFVTVVTGAILLAIDRVGEFVTDVYKTIHFDFSPDLIQGVINWAIFTDLLFSILYLGPCLLLVLANRSARSRSMFLNIVMWVGDHSGGPFIALSEILSAFASVVRLTKK